MTQLNALQNIYDVVEKIFPGLPTADKEGRAQESRDDVKPHLDFEAFLQTVRQEAQATLRRREIAVAEILAQSFVWKRDWKDLVHAVHVAMEQLRRAEASEKDEEGKGIERSGWRLFRKLWYDAVRKADSRTPALPGLAHAEEISFVRLQPVDVTWWARWILLVEEYHRTDPVRHESRLDRYRHLKTERPDSLLDQWEDVLIWVEQALLQDPDVGLEEKARQCSRQIETRLVPELRSCSPISALMYLLLRCHRFCLAEVMDPTDELRLTTLRASRRIQSLTDLMLMLYDRCMNEDPLPDLTDVLDDLVEDGFNIEHESFKDPYMVEMVPPEETPLFDRATVRLFTPIDSLTGELEQDCQKSAGRWLNFQKTVLDRFKKEAEDLLAALDRPLPKRGLLKRSVRFLTSCCLARYPVGNLPELSDLAAEVRRLFPDSVVGKLVRQRRGFELSTRKDLGGTIQRECARQREVLQRTLAEGRVEGERDFEILVRLAIAAKGLSTEREKDASEDLVRTIQGVLSAIDTSGDENTFLTSSLEMFLEHSFPIAGTPLEILDAVQCLVPRDAVLVGLGREGYDESASLGVYEKILKTASEAFYRLVLSRARGKRGDPPLELSPSHVDVMVRILVPPFSVLRERALERLVEEFRAKASRFYRRENGLIIFDDQEWEAAAAHLLIQAWNGEFQRAVDAGEADRIRAFLEKETIRFYVPEEVLWRRSPGAMFLTWISGDEKKDLDPEVVDRVLSFLPGLDCGSCGEPRCRGFASGLAGGRYRPAGCVHLSLSAQHEMQRVLEEIWAEEEVGRVPDSPFHLLRDPRAWRRAPRQAPARRAAENALDISRQVSRRLILEKLEELWNRMSPKLDVYREPNMDDFYQLLVDTVGYEAAESITEEEREWLISNGERRLEAEFDRLKRKNDWLHLERLKISSRPFLEAVDPETRARKAYAGVLYLHHLDASDRNRLLRYRLERYEEGFSQWWNQDLLSMNHPDYVIDNWEEFSKVIKNAYWHQENFPPPRILARNLYDAWGEEVVADLVRDWIRFMAAKIAERRGFALRSLNDPPRLKSVSEVRSVLENLMEEIRARDLLLSDSMEYGDRAFKVQDQLWEAFQKRNCSWDPDFRVVESELTPEEKAVLENRTGTRSGAELSRIFREPGGAETFVRAMIERVVLRYENDLRLRERLEQSLRSGNPDKLPARVLWVWATHRVADGSSSEAVEEEIAAWFQKFPAWSRKIMVEWLQRMVAFARWEFLKNAFPGVVVDEPRDSLLEDFVARHPAWMERVRSRVQAEGDFDRDRLLHYLFILAKMEGHLDVITGLLREIRETSDVIEAAWLQFTNDRLSEGAPPPPKTTPPRCPILANKVKNKEAVVRCLAEGLSRSEKRDVAAAVREILLFMRFHIVQAPPEYEDMDAVYRAFREGGYDLEDLDEEALRRAFAREWNNRSRLREDRIWIMTMAVARRTAAMSVELSEAERAFGKVRQQLLKGGRDDAIEDLCRRRGVALGKIKEQVYRELSELLEEERMASFRKRIRQIVRQLDRKRLEIVKSWVQGEINRFSVFHILRQYQKRSHPPTRHDFLRFLVTQWFQRLEEIQSSRGEDQDARIQELDEAFRAVLGISLISLEREMGEKAESVFARWCSDKEETVRRALEEVYSV